MARIKTTQLIAQATDIAGRANIVGTDPAVVKAWGAASTDVRQAFRSTALAALETRSAWNRASANTQRVV